MVTDWKPLAADYLVRLFDERVLSHPRPGEDRFVPEPLRRQLMTAGYHARGFSLAAAYIASSVSGEHALSGQPALRQLAVEVGESLRGMIDRMLSAPGEPPPHFAFRFVPFVYELIEPYLKAVAQRRWRRTMQRYIADAVQWLDRKQDAWGKPGPYTGTGPNHLYETVAQIETAGRVLGDDAARRYARRCIRALCKQQTEAGYFPEHSGPSMNYMHVYIAGLCDYVASSGDPKIRAVLERAVDFVTRTLYPDLRMIETIDERNRLGGPLGYPLAHATCTPASRSIVLAGLEEAIESLPVVQPADSGWALSSLVLGLLHAPDGPAGTVPSRKKVHHDSFDGLVNIGRKAGWFHVLSGYHHSPQLYNPFQFERTQNLSVYHDACGLIIGGGNDKFAPNAATISLCEALDVYYFPPLGASASGSAGTGRLSLDYGAAKAELRVRVVSARLLDLTAAVTTNFGEQKNRLNLQLPLAAGTRLEVDGVAVELTQRSKPLQIVGVRRFLTLPGAWTIEVKGGAELHWPHIPFVKIGVGSMATAVAFLRIDLDVRGGSRVVRIHVPPKTTNKGKVK